MANNQFLSNEEIAEQLQLMADLLEIQGADFFRVRAYRQAVEAIEHLSSNLTDLVAAEKDLAELPGIGKAIAEKIVDLVNTGKISQLEKLKKQVPPELVDLTRIENLGPKRVGKLYRELEIVTLADLRAALEDGRVEALEGFGEKLVTEIAADLERAGEVQGRILWADADKLAQPLLKFLKSIKGVKKAEIAGSYRRKKETVGDFDLLASGDDGEAIIQAFVKYPDIKKVQMEGDTRATVVLKSNLQVDLRVVPAESYGAALQYFTGSKAHGIATRRQAQSLGLKLNEYGVYKGEKQVAGKTEKGVYKILQLDWVPPELREDRGEVQAAAQNRLPDLVEFANIIGDFQFHTTSSDGTADLETMAKAAQKAGLKYAVVSDHSKYLGITNGLDAKQVEAQIKEVEALNTNFKNFQLLKGIEVDILPDGSLALEDKILQKLDIVVAAIHDHFKLSREEQTERLLKAIKHPLVNIIAHPTGRIIGQRSGYQVDLEKVATAAATEKVALEINAHPNRLDLDDIAAKFAKESGTLLVLSSDAHAPEHFGVLRYGVNQARRGWLSTADLLNSWSVQHVLEFFGKA